MTGSPQSPPPAGARAPQGWAAERSAHSAQARRVRARRVHRRRLTAVALALGILVAMVLLLSGRASHAGPASPASRATALAAARPITAKVISIRSRAPGSPAGGSSREGSPSGHVALAPSPGSLPQTHALPSSGTAAFRALMASLWTGIQRDSVARALPAFFPQGAYVQLKAIGSPASDWKYRLVHDYAQDIEAAHRLLGGGAGTARLVAVKVPSSYAHWVPTGVCYNDIGYYEVPNARIVYREGGRLSSFGIASMISWRGEWYVVHLGAILREGDGGVVDEPSSGTGSSAYSGTC